MHYRARTLLGILATSALLVGCASASPGASSADQPGVSAVLTATSGQIGATSAPAHASATRAAGGTPDPSRAVLGSPEAAFIRRLGQPGPGSTPGSVDHFGRAGGSTCDAYVVTFTAGHAREVLHRVCQGPVPDIDQRLNDSLAFLPEDTLVGKAMQTAAGDEGTVNTSASLGKALPPDAFQDCNKQALQPGTFALVMTKDGWVIASGTCP